VHALPDEGDHTETWVHALPDDGDYTETWVHALPDDGVYTETWWTNNIDNQLDAKIMVY
jgi:hypothetical protein